MTEFSFPFASHLRMDQGVNWLPHDPNWKMSVLFLIFVGMLGLAMKFSTLLNRNRSVKGKSLYWFTVLTAPTSLPRCRPLNALPGFLARTALSTSTLALYYWTFWTFIAPLQPPAFALGYLGAPVLLLISPLAVAVATLSSLPLGLLLPPLHDNPPLMRSVADFWGRRWNLWFSDWFRYVIFAPLRRRPTLAMVLVFFVSGVMHEWVINLPLHLVTGRKLFGTMMIYFLLQAAGMLLERRFFHDRPRARRAFAWVVVFGPSPLILNEGLLRTLHLWPH